MNIIAIKKASADPLGSIFLSRRLVLAVVPPRRSVTGRLHTNFGVLHRRGVGIFVGIPIHIVIISFDGITLLIGVLIVVIVFSRHDCDALRRTSVCVWKRRGIRTKNSAAGAGDVNRRLVQKFIAFDLNYKGIPL